jgi:RNA polymerase sigma-54 factor
VKQGLQLGLGQSLTLSPQLQQAIRLLQLSTLELRGEMLEQLYANPLLELPDDQQGGEGDLFEAASDDDQPTDESEENTAIGSAESAAPPDSGALEFDHSADSRAEPSSLATPTSSAVDDAADFFQVTETLRDHLAWQLNLTPFSDEDRLIAETLLDGLDDDGLLSSSLLSLTEHLHNPALELGAEEVEAVLHRLQQFDPPGVFARSLNESLRLQLLPLSGGDTAVECALQLVDGDLAKLVNTDPAQLATQLAVSAEQVRAALALIRSLNPHPGSSFSSAAVEHISPDLRVDRIAEQWVVRLNDQLLPQLQINQLYADMIKRGDRSTDNQYLKDHLAQARWFLRSIESRNDTLLRVGEAIMARQNGFLERGAIGMVPLILADIAEPLELHESTVSRVTTNKYIATPRGVFELKYFFSSHVGTAGGGECSSTAVCAMLKSMIDSEQPNRPLSDSKLTALLADRGVAIARRTVAKYRESMNIPSSSQRKRF